MTRCLYLQRKEVEKQQCMVDHVDSFEYAKSPFSAFSYQVPEWVQLELEALFKQKNLLREV